MNPLVNRQKMDQRGERDLKRDGGFFRRMVG